MNVMSLIERYDPCSKYEQYLDGKPEKIGRYDCFGIYGTVETGRWIIKPNTINASMSIEDFLLSSKIHNCDKDWLIDNLFYEILDGSLNFDIEEIKLEQGKFLVRTSIDTGSLTGVRSLTYTVDDMIALVWEMVDTLEERDEQ